MREGTKIASENILYPVCMVSDGKGQIWSIMTYSEAVSGENKGHIKAKRISGENREVLITSESGNYGPAKAVFDGEIIWITYTEYRNAEKCIWLAGIGERKLFEPVMITRFGKFDNPEIVLHDNNIWIVWESYESGKASLECRKFSVKSRENDECILKYMSEIKTITQSEEIAYKPSMISNGRQLYLVYESFFSGRYHLVARCLSSPENEFSEPIEIGFDSDNDQYASLCVHNGKVLIAWENSSPLRKGFKWKNAKGDIIIMPAFGHGWKVLTRLGLRRIYYENGNWEIESLSCSGAIPPEIKLDQQKSSGCPKVFVDKNGTIFICYLSWADQPTRGWQIRIKHFDGEKWEESLESGLIQKQRVTPAVLYKKESDELFILGSDPEEEIENCTKNGTIWTQLNSSTYVKKINVSHLCDVKTPLFSPTLVKPIGNEIVRNRKSKGRYSIDYEGKKLNLYWGDLHMHTNISPCSLNTEFHCTEIEEKYRFCRDVANLDFAMVTDHDTMSEHEWNRTREIAHFNNIPGEFTAFVGLEWTSSNSKDKPNQGHYNILYRNDGPLFSRRNKGHDSIVKVWNKLEKGQALTIPHHPGDKVHTLDWRYFNSDFEPLVEIFQVRGSYEYDSCPMNPTNYGRYIKKGHSIRDGLNRGYRFGFTAGGEHEGVGVTAVYAEELTRDAIFEALRERHTYGTTGEHIILDFRLNGYLMGSEIVISDGNPTIEVRAIGTNKIRKIRLVRSGETLKEWRVDGMEVNLTWTDNLSLEEIDKKDHYYYVVVEQVNGEMAWASPVFVTFKLR